MGRHLVLSLAGDGHDVVVLSRRPRRARNILPPGTRVEAWDPAEAAAGLPLLLANAAAVVNLTGADVPCRRPIDHHRHVRDSPLACSRALVEAMGALPPSERPAAFLDACHCAEREAPARRADGLHVRVVLLRLGLVVGHGGPVPRRLAPLVRAGAGGRIGSPDQSLPWIALEDAVGMVRRAITGWDISGPFNLAAPRASGDRRMSPAKALAASYEFLQPDLEQALERALRVSAGPSAKVA
ncbi:TIGR01777 family oxidoreductase [soil metagenome]